MKKYLMMLCLLLVAGGLTGCGGGGGSSSEGAQKRTVLVDYRHDETETSLFDYFPKKVTVRPGDTVEFKQAWTGEPHSVSFGRIVETVLDPIIAVVQRVEKSGEIPKGEPEEFRAFNMPFAIDEEDGVPFAVQNAAQPCYVAETDAWPGDAKTPCPQRERPAFTGRDAIYSSGLIPYEGVGENTFDMPIAEDATPGTYGFFCNVHGPLQYGEVEIVPKGTEIPSSREVAKAARQEAEARTKGMVANHKAALAGKTVIGGEPGREEEFETKGKRLIGLPSRFFDGGKIVHGIINEFVPRNDRARVGQKVTWTFAGHHTISFNVPKYFPIFTIGDDGTVTYNEKVSTPAGWPGPPEDPEPPGGPEGSGPPPEGAPEGGEAPPGEEPSDADEGPGGPPPEREPHRVDAGNWDGKGFRSTGLDYSGGDEFSVTFTRPGTYPFACLIHPSMVGTIVVK